MHAHGVPARHGLFSRQQTLGETGEPELVQEAEVIVKPPDVLEYELADFPVLFRRRPAAARSRHLLVTVPFELPELYSDAWFATVRTGMWFEVPGARVLRLDPGERDVDAPADTDAELLSGFTPPALPRRTLHDLAVVRTWGLGGGEGRWRFTAQPGVPIREGDAQVRTLVELPRATTVVPGLVACSVVIESSRLGRVDHVEAALRDHLSFRLELPART